MFILDYKIIWRAMNINIISLSRVTNKVPVENVNRVLCFLDMNLKKQLHKGFCCDKFIAL